MLVVVYCLQCFDTVGWAEGRASGLYKTADEWWGAVVVIRGGDYRLRPPQHFGWGGRKRKCPPTNCPFSYFVDICLMFASQIQLKIIIFLCANGKSKLV